MSSQALPNIQVVVTINGKPLNTYTFSEREILIGRGADCHVPLDNPGASRHHAKIIREGDTLHLHDMQSGNGTLVNGKPITQTVVKTNDTIGISKFTLMAKLTDKPLREPGSPPGANASSPDFNVEHTVFLSAQDRAKIAQQGQPPGARPAPAPLKPAAPVAEKSSPLAAVFAAGLAVGLLLGWSLWA